MTYLHEHTQCDTAQTLPQYDTKQQHTTSHTLSTLHRRSQHMLHTTRTAHTHTLLSVPNSFVFMVLDAGSVPSTQHSSERGGCSRRLPFSTSFLEVALQLALSACLSVCLCLLASLSVSICLCLCPCLSVCQRGRSRSSCSCSREKKRSSSTNRTNSSIAIRSGRSSKRATRPPLFG